MGARTGAEFTAGLRDQREVWLGNERVEDVTTHPAFRAAVEHRGHVLPLEPGRFGQGVQELTLRHGLLIHAGTDCESLGISNARTAKRVANYPFTEAA